MSQRAMNEAVIHRYCDAWKRGDLGAILGCYHDDIVLHYFGRSPLSGVHRGKPAAVQALASAQRLTNRKLLEIHDIVVSDEHAIVLARERFERDGRVLELERVLVYHVRDDRLAECWLYDQDQRAVDEFWS